MGVDPCWPLFNPCHSQLPAEGQAESVMEFRELRNHGEVPSLYIQVCTVVLQSHPPTGRNTLVTVALLGPAFLWGPASEKAHDAFLYLPRVMGHLCPFGGEWK